MLCQKMSSLKISAYNYIYKLLLIMVFITIFCSTPAFAGVIETEISLNKGWNMISTWINPVNTSISSILASIEGRYSSVWAYDAVSSEWQYFIPNNPSYPNTLNSIEAGKGYFINMNTEASLKISGNRLLNTDIPLYMGWNLIGYNCSSDQSLEEGLKSIDGKYTQICKYNNSWESFSLNKPDFLNKLNILETEKAYWINVTEDCNLEFPPPPEPPIQALQGPGSSEYKHTAIRLSTYGVNEKQYWIFEPDSPAPDTAPLVVFNHGWMALDPSYYRSWINHITKKGNIVIYPRYQNIVSQPKTFTQNAINSVKEAIQNLQSEGHVKPELDNFAIVGHSVGGLITANMAALYDSNGLPEPKAIMLIQTAKQENFNILTDRLDLIPSSILMLTIIGEEDNLAGDISSKIIYNDTIQIPLENKDYITMTSDYYGNPPLVADHFAPVADPNSGYLNGYYIGVNALDYYGLWKLFDALTDAAFYDKNREYALGNTSEQRFMGIWSDGRFVKELSISKNP